MREPSTIVVGAGPAGLTAAYLLAKAGRAVTVLESDPEYVGGIARTERYRGFRFDIGGHRFFSKSAEVEALWTELLGPEMLERERLSRIYYRGRFFSYPLRAGDALRKLGVVESALCVLSYLAARLRPVRDPRSFEDWVTNAFGARLYRIFFKTYTEKIWGMSCRDISADWAAQRIKGLSLRSAIANALSDPEMRRSRGTGVKTLIESFRYPRLGPGMLWEATRDRIEALGGIVRLGQRVVACQYRASTSDWEVVSVDAEGRRSAHVGRDVICSAALDDLVEMLTPAPAPPALAAAARLRHRDFLLVALILKDRGTMPDNWIYIHDPSVKVGRIQNFKAWSEDLVPDPSLACLGLEYFCFEGDGLWESSDDELRRLATNELVEIGLASADDVVDARIVRQRAAYPVYDLDYADHVGTIREAITDAYPGLHVIGRNGMHKYNNQDHAMMTAMLTVRNILAGERRYDVWQVNQDAEYHEAGDRGGATGERFVPRRLD